MTTKTFDQFRKSRVILMVSLLSEEHDGAVVVTPSGKEIGLDHENGFSFMDGDFFISDDATAVFVYEGSYFIEQLNSFQYLLQIENDSYMTTNLTALEKTLYDWIDFAPVLPTIPAQ
jgi:hypothetical protein